MSDLRTDLNYAKDATFKVDLPDGDYSVRIYHSNPKYYGTVSYIADNFNVYFEGRDRHAGRYGELQRAQHRLRGRTVIRTMHRHGVGRRAGDPLRGSGRPGRELRGVGDRHFAPATLPGDMPLLAAGDPQDGGAAAISVDAVAAGGGGSGGAVVGGGADGGSKRRRWPTSSSPWPTWAARIWAWPTRPRTVRIDDDAAMMGWSVVSGQSSVVSGQWSAMAADGQLTTDN